MAVGGGSRTLAAHDLLAREPAHVLELAVARRRARPPPSRADEAEHQRGRERPRLRRAVAHVGDPHAGLLAHLARDGLLEALPRLDEARQRAVAARRPRAPGGRAARGRRRVTSMITTGSVRGWCCGRRTPGSARMCPASRLSVGAPQFAQKRWRRCQFSSATAWATIPPSACDSTGARSRRPRRSPGKSSPGSAAKTRATVAVDAEEHELDAVGRRARRARTAAGARRSTTHARPAGRHDARRGIGQPRGQPRARRAGAARRGPAPRRRTCSGQPSPANRWRPCARSARARARRSPRAPAPRRPRRAGRRAAWSA